MAETAPFQAAAKTAPSSGADAAARIFSNALGSI
jgi:hypothetical protein